MGRNKLQRGNSSPPERRDLTHLWKPSSLFTAYLALMPLPSGKVEFNQSVLQTSLHLQKAALQVSCNTYQDMPARSKSDPLGSVSRTQAPSPTTPLKWRAAR